MSLGSNVSIEIPPGFERPGTALAAKGRWYDGNLVRWHDGVMRGVGGWTATNAPALTMTRPGRGELAWSGRDREPYVFFGEERGFSIFRYSGGVLSRLALPGSVTSAFPVPISPHWHTDNFGGDLVYLHHDGDLEMIHTDASGGALTYDALGNAPGHNASLVVTPERFIVALGSGGDPHRITWCAQGDPQDWSVEDPQSTAGDLDMPSHGKIVTGSRSRGETLIWTETDLLSLTYLGGDFVYGVRPAGSAGIIGPRAKVRAGANFYWMGRKGFWAYTGQIQRLSCPVSDYVFDRIRSDAAGKVWAVSNREFSEVTWFYPSGASTECNSYVTYNYGMGIWYFGEMARSAGVDAGLLPYPLYLGGASNTLYWHDEGNTYDGGAKSFAETGIIDISNGQETMFVDRIYPDASLSGEMSFTLKHGMTPREMSAETDDTFTLSGEADVLFPRLRTRHLQFRAEKSDASWRFGVPRIRMRPAGWR